MTDHNRIVILLMLVLTGAVVAGLMVESGGAAQGVDESAIGDTEVYEAAQYIEERYASDEDATAAATAEVFVRVDDGNALSRSSLLTALEYQLEVADDLDEHALAEDGIYGPPNAIATHLAGDPSADLEAQHAAVEAASDEAVAEAAAAVFTGGEETRYYLPSTYESGTATAEGFRMTFTFDEADESGLDASVPEAAQEVLHDRAGAYDDPEIFTTGQFAMAELSEALMNDSLWLVLPPILVVLLLILGFAYRDFTDVVIGFTGSMLALVWTFGLMGWMGILNQQTAIIAPVLVAALSIDFGFHVFMRYREYRGVGDGIRRTMRRATAAVAVAFALVTITAAIGFLSNLTSPVSLIREVGIAITLGVVSALVIFTTLVPALKVSADGLWERFGFDRRKTPLGKGQYLGRVLGLGPLAARRFAVGVIIVTLLVGGAGGLAFGELDREAFQDSDIDDVAEWKTQLPGPMAYEAHESDAAQQFAFAQSHFQADRDSIGDGGAGFTQLLIRGEDVASADGMAAVAAGHDAAGSADEEVVLKQGDTVHVISPLSLMEATAEEDPEFAETLADHDTDGDGVPDTDVIGLLHAFHETAPERASQVIERTDDGRVESMLVLVPARATYGSERAATMHGIADAMAAESDHRVDAVGIGTLNDAELRQIADGIVVTMGLALIGVLVVLTLVYWFVHRRALLGALTVLPIGLALGLVFGAMYLLGQPLTMLTALLVSITIGMGIDYNIHISDRFAQELAAGRDTMAALRETVTGTGGALLGSVGTSGGAFALLMLIPHPQFVSFGLIVALALAASFLLSVYVLPSLLYLYGRHAPGTPTATGDRRGVVGEGD
ncbi:MAG: efflux RND transporter permease subunit [Halobacteriales archaeon]